MRPRAVAVVESRGKLPFEAVCFLGNAVDLGPEAHEGCSRENGKFAYRHGVDAGQVVGRVLEIRHG